MAIDIAYVVIISFNCIDCNPKVTSLNRSEGDVENALIPISAVVGSIHRHNISTTHKNKIITINHNYLKVHLGKGNLVDLLD